MRTPTSASTAPAPSLASRRADTSLHHVPLAMLRVALAIRIARQPSGHDRSVAFTLCNTAVTPATAGALKLVPDIDSPTADTVVPLAQSSGSSRSP